VFYVRLYECEKERFSFGAVPPVTLQDDKTFVRTYFATATERRSDTIEDETPVDLSILPHTSNNNSPRPVMLSPPSSQHAHSDIMMKTPSEREEEHD